MPKKILVVPDTHFPFANNKAIKRLIELAKKLKPDCIVQVGDLMDHYSHSKFPRSHNLMTPKQEAEKGHEQAAEMWERLQSAAPNAKCWQIYGNHSVRPYRRLMERYPEIEGFTAFRDFYTFNGVSTLHDPRAELEIDGIVFIHGYYSGLGKHCLFNLKSVACGHSHTGGTVFYNIGKRTIWELNAGYLADISTVPLGYTPQRYTRWTIGCGTIIDGAPAFVPFDL